MSTPRRLVVATDTQLGPYARFVKPVLDLIGGLVLSLATLPLIVVITIAIWVSIGRPAIITQRRVGKNGKAFRLFKFRTMLPDRRNGANDYSGRDRRLMHKRADDPRHTDLGRFLRKWSLDEIPQFWNVATGSMSLIGPRPELERIVESKYQPWQHQRHAVKPGVTGVWQTTARTDDRLMYEHTEVDLEYLKNITFWGDLKILLRTVPAALGHRQGL